MVMSGSWTYCVFRPCHQLGARRNSLIVDLNLIFCIRYLLKKMRKLIRYLLYLYYVQYDDWTMKYWLIKYYFREFWVLFWSLIVERSRLNWLIMIYNLSYFNSPYIDLILFINCLSVDRCVCGNWCELAQSIFWWCSNVEWERSQKNKHILHFICHNLSKCNNWRGWRCTLHWESPTWGWS